MVSSCADTCRTICLTDVKNYVTKLSKESGNLDTKEKNENSKGEKNGQGRELHTNSILFKTGCHSHPALLFCIFSFGKHLVEITNSLPCVN